jgi:hypothetical protein
LGNYLYLLYFVGNGDILEACDRVLAENRFVVGHRAILAD